jgi:uncharacterized membrane protein
MKNDSQGASEIQIAALTARVWRLEEALRRHGISLEDAAVKPVAQIQPAEPGEPIPWQVFQSMNAPAEAAQESDSARHSEPHPDAPPLFAGFAATTAGSVESDSLESRIGSQWFNRIGILAVLIAVAWFLKLAIDNHWIGPLGRVLVGLVAGAGFVVWSERFRSHGFTAFSYSLKALGSSTLYLSLWAAFSLYHLLPGSVAFLAMIAVTMSNGVMAWVQDSELLAAYAVAGALSTPMLLSTGENHELVLFGYLLLLDLLVLALVALKPWSRLLFAAFVGTVVFYIGWSFSFYAREALAETACFTAAYFLLFAFAPRLVLSHTETAAGHQAWDQLAQTLMPLLNAAFGFLGFLSIFHDAGYSNSGPWLAVLLAAFYLGMLNLPEHGRWRASPPLLSALHLAAAVTFLTIAIPLKAHGRWITIGWLAEGTALLWIESRLRLPLLRVLSLLCLALGVVASVANNRILTSSPFFNARFGCYLAAIAALAVVAWLALHEEETETPNSLQGKPLAALSILLINLLILLAVGWEIDTFWWVRGWKGESALLHSYEMYAQFTYSAFFMIFGALLLVLGFWRRSAFLRWQALVLLAATIGKVFLWDMSALSQGYRILSFLGLGALLLAVSFVYQSDLLHLRREE